MSQNPKDNPVTPDDNAQDEVIDTELDTERERGVNPGGRSPQGRPDDDMEGGRGSNEGGRGDIPDDLNENSLAHPY